MPEFIGTSTGLSSDLGMRMDITQREIPHNQANLSAETRLKLTHGWKGGLTIGTIKIEEFDNNQWCVSWTKSWRISHH